MAGMGKEEDMVTIDWSGRWDAPYSMHVKKVEDKVTIQAVRGKDREDWSGSEFLHLRPDAIPALATAIRLLRELAAEEAKKSPEAVGA